jgi:hypothetical protein
MALPWSEGKEENLMAKRLRMKPDAARRAAEQLLALTKKDKTKLEGRLDAGTLTGLQEDVRLLSTSTASALTSRVQRKAATRQTIQHIFLSHPVCNQNSSNSFLSHRDTEEKRAHQGF